MYLPSLSIIFLTFETFALPVAVTGHPYFATSLSDSVRVINIFFTNYLIGDLIKSINFLQFSKNLHYRIVMFRANFYMSSNFFNIPQSFLQQWSTTTTGSSVMTLTLYIYSYRIVQIPCDRYCIKLFKSVTFLEILQSVIALCYNLHLIPKYRCCLFLGIY